MTRRLAPPLGHLPLLAVLCLVACGPAETDAARESAVDQAAEKRADAGDGSTADLRPQVEPPPTTATATATDPATDTATDTDTATAATLPDLTGWTVGTGHRDIHTLGWRLVDRDEVPRNEEFELEVLILRDGQPQPGLRLAVSGWMPEHGHGLVRSPLVEEVGDGLYLVSGMLLHMRGNWQLRFQVFAGRDTETATFDLEL